jgi:hypothetical protein
MPGRIIDRFEGERIISQEVSAKESKQRSEGTLLNYVHCTSRMPGPVVEESGER